MKLQTVPSEGGRSEITIGLADRGPVAYVEQLIGGPIGFTGCRAADRRQGHLHRA